MVMNGISDVAVNIESEKIWAGCVLCNSIGSTQSMALWPHLACPQSDQPIIGTMKSKSNVK